jgi:hypothetical protein
MKEMPKKTKTPQPETPEIRQGRDFFQTPRYATELLLDFIPGDMNAVWECAAGNGMMSRVFSANGFTVVSTDLVASDGIEKCNFLLDEHPERCVRGLDIIVTNPPFSLKQDFYRRCMAVGKPFALLIPADYSGWNIDAVWKHGCEKIIPTRRIDFLTPNTIDRANDYQIFLRLVGLFPGLGFKKIDDAKLTQFWQHAAENIELFERLVDIPTPILRKVSSSDFHSFWLTRGLNLGKSETFVELSNEQKDRIL